MFELKFQFAVPDLLFHEELIDLGPYSRQDLLAFGLSVESLDVEGVELALAYQSARPALSLVDSFALALAGRQGWHLLTEDRPCVALLNSKASCIGMPCGSSTACWMPAFYRRLRSWAALEQDAGRSKMSCSRIRLGCSHPKVGGLSPSCCWQLGWISGVERRTLLELVPK